MRLLLFLSMAFLFLNEMNCQKPDQILIEGKNLYLMEKASWYGTDYFLENYSEKQNEIGGYFSYLVDESLVNVFYDRSNNPKILARIYFNKLSIKQPINVDDENTAPTELEHDLIRMREDALEQISSAEEGFFKYYENTSFNVIPYINGKEKKVYILTASRSPDVILLGNDYLLTYSKSLQLKKKERIHNSLISFPVKADDEVITTMHSHVNSALIDPTDICTLLLYKDYFNWDKHLVIGRKYVSIFSIENEKLTVVPLKAWQKIRESANQ